MTLVATHPQLILKVICDEGPPPGEGLTTCKLTVCGAAKSAAGIAARNCPGLTNTVLRGDPFHSTTDPGTKLDPVMVSQVFPAGAVTPLGDAAVRDGTGFGVDERGSTEDPCRTTIRPAPLPQKSTIVRNAKPSVPHRTRSRSSPASPSSSVVPARVKRLASYA